MCKKCETEPVYEFTNKRKVCKNCFIKWFQKKFLYTLRKYQMIQREEKVGFYEKKDFRGVVLKNLLESFSGRAGSEIKRITQKNKSFDKIALEDTADVIAKEFSYKIINENIKNAEELFPVNRKTIRPLCLFLDKEVRLYAELKNLEFRETKKMNIDKICFFIEELEKKHPEIKTSVVSSYLKLFS